MKAFASFTEGHYATITYISYEDFCFFFRAVGHKQVVLNCRVDLASLRSPHFFLFMTMSDLLFQSFLQYFMPTAHIDVSFNYT